MYTWMNSLTSWTSFSPTPSSRTTEFNGLLCLGWPKGLQSAPTTVYMIVLPEWVSMARARASSKMLAKIWRFLPTDVICNRWNEIYFVTPKNNSQFSIQTRFLWESQIIHQEKYLNGFPWLHHSLLSRSFYPDPRWTVFDEMDSNAWLEIILRRDFPGFWFDEESANAQVLSISCPFLKSEIENNMTKK